MTIFKICMEGGISRSITHFHILQLHKWANKFPRTYISSHLNSTADKQLIFSHNTMMKPGLCSLLTQLLDLVKKNSKKQHLNWMLYTHCTYSVLRRNSHIKFYVTVNIIPSVKFRIYFFQKQLLFVPLLYPRAEVSVLQKPESTLDVPLFKIVTEM